MTTDYPVDEALTEYFRDRDRGDRGRCTLPLSMLIRPNSEAAPWVIDEVRKLEAELNEARAAVAALVEAAREALGTLDHIQHCDGNCALELIETEMPKDAYALRAALAPFNREVE